MKKIRKRIYVLDPIIDTAIKLEDNGMPESGQGGSDEDVMELAIDLIGEEEINRTVGEYWTYVGNLEQQAKGLGEESGLLEQQTGELNKLQEFYQTLQ